LLKDLTELGLDFLANDLQSLWEGKPLGDHAKNYFQDLSESITNDPEALRRAILYGQTTEQVQAVRVLLLGSGGAGKTSLAKLLKGQDPREKAYEAATLGVDYQQHQPIRLHQTLPDLNINEDDLDLYLWDFGGQTIFHGLHRAFLHENCVYVLVVDNRHEQAPDEWLHQIRHLAGSQAQVLLVTNEYENCYTRQNESRLLREFTDLLDENSFFYFSCVHPDFESTTSSAFKAFVSSLLQTSRDSRRAVFTTTLDAQEKLAEQYEQQTFLHESVVKRLIAEVTSEDELTLKQLLQLGFIVHVKKGGRQYCLKPAWAVDHAYQLLHAKPLRNAHGLADMDTLEVALQGQVEAEQVDYLTELLNDRALCCLLPNGKFFFPDAAAANEPAEAQDLLQQQPSVKLHFDLPYLPLGFHARLVHGLFKEQATRIQHVEHIWRHGFILSSYQAQAVVHYRLRKTSLEVVLTGDASEFAPLFQTFYTALTAAVISDSGIQESDIHLSVLFQDKPFSVHSSSDFLVALKSIRTVKDLSEEVAKMAANETRYYAGDHVENKGGQGSNFATKSENFTQTSYNIQHAEITQDQRQQLAVIVNELLKQAHELPPDDLAGLAEIKKALDKPDEEKARALLPNVWTGVKDVVTFTNDQGMPLAEKIAEHKGAIMSAITAAVAALTK